MRKVLGTIFYIVSGFFVYMVCLLAFIQQPAMEKWVMIVMFTIPAIIFQVVGSAMNRFSNWRRHTGIVLLSGAGVSTFVILTFVSLLMTDEFKQMMQPDTLDLFGAYVSGGVFTLCIVAAGIILLKSNKAKIHESSASDG